VLKRWPAELAPGPRAKNLRAPCAIWELPNLAFPQGTGEAPYMEMQQGWSVDGIQWKGRLDARVNAFDVRGAITNAGQ